MNFINQLLENLKEEKFILYLKTIFGVLIQLICNSFKKWLKDNNNMKMQSMQNEKKSVVAKKFIRTLKTKIYRHMTAVSRNVYFNLLDDIISKYNNTYHNSIKMNSIDVESNFYFEDNFDFNESDPIFQVGDHVKISKYRKMFGK